MSINGKLSQKFMKKKKSYIAHSSANSRYITRTASPSINPKLPELEQKVMRLQYKLAQARSLIAKYEADQREQKKVQKEFIKSYHMRVMSQQQNNFDSKMEEIENKIVKERNAVEDIWKRRYEEMKKMYEEKLREMEKNKTLCGKCKAFIDNHNQIEEKIRRIRWVESNVH